ncbi:hypothetical protein ACQCX2_10025 [Propionibacteriaceae bacterium Y1700]|uniref:hypothetical protein n=1 Tax=Microlunatus sp. Y1700 TaxID=3418487 RepID=UPI003DA78084
MSLSLSLFPATRRRRPRLGTALCAGVLAALTITGLATAPQAAALPPEEASDATAEPGSRWVTADRQKVFEISYPAEPGVTRLVNATIVVSQATDTEANGIGVSLGINCRTDGAQSESTGSIENVHRGQQITLRPRMLYTPTSTGTVVCQLTQRGFIGAPDGTQTGVSRAAIENGSELRHSIGVRDTKQRTYTLPTKLSTKSAIVGFGQQWGEFPSVSYTVPEGKKGIEVMSDHKVTSCSYSGGSSDSTTDGKDLCTGFTGGKGASVEWFAYVTPLDAEGNACAPKQTIISRSRNVSLETHHASLYGTGTYILPTTAGCTRNVRVKSYVRNPATYPGGASRFMIHATSERTAILPI